MEFPSTAMREAFQAFAGEGSGVSEVPISTAHPGGPPCLTVQHHPTLKVKNRVFIFKINMN